MKNLMSFILLMLISFNVAALNNSAANGLADQVDPSDLKLATVFVGDDGGLVYLRETDQYVYWFAEHPGRGYSHVFRGERNGNRIRGRIISVPKYSATTVGKVTMEIRTGGTLHQISATKKAPFNKLSPRKLSEVKSQLPRHAGPGFRAKINVDFDGAYQDSIGRRFYVRTLNKQVVFFVESKFEQGSKPTAAFVFFGEWVGNDRRFVTGELVALAKGKRKTKGTFSLGFLEDGKLSGQSNFQHLKNVLASRVPIRTNPAPVSSTPTPTGANVFPDNPRWIEFSGKESNQLVLDFGVPLDDQPIRMTLPINYLPDWLPVEDGEPVIPDNLCGLHIEGADNIYWQDGEKIIYSRENLLQVDFNAYRNGVRFDGPIGGCEDSGKGWQFFNPITTMSGEAPEPGLKLVIEIDHGGEINFVNHQVIKVKPLSPDKIFKENTFKTFKDNVKAIIDLKKSEEYCKLDQYVEKLCTPLDPEDPFPEWPLSVCPVGNEFASQGHPFSC